MDGLVGVSVRVPTKADIPAMASVLLCVWNLADHPYFEFVRGRGFIVTDSNPGCLVKNEKLEPDALDFLDRPEVRVHLTAGDSDWV